MTTQIDIEEKMRDRGLNASKERWYKNRERGDVSRSEAVKNVMFGKHGRHSKDRDDLARVSYPALMSVAIQVYLDEAFNGTAGRRRSAAEVLKRFDPYDVAYHTCSTAFNGLCLKHTATITALALGNALEELERYTVFTRENKGASKWLQREFKKRRIHKARHKRTYMSVLAGHKGINLPRWSKEQKLHVGMRLLSMFCDVTKLAHMPVVHMGKKRYKHFEALPQLLTWIENERDDLALAHPPKLPMIEAPRPWSKGKYGGYYTFDLDIIKGAREFGGNQLELLEEADMSQVYKAVNTLDATPYRVNKRVLEVLDYCWTMGLEVGSLVSSDQITPDPMPDDVSGDIKRLTPKQQEKRKAWRKYARSVHERNAAVQSSRMQAMRTIEMARDFRDQPALYFPHQLDFRGRVYDIPIGLNPQGPDYSRSLLEFAVGKHILNEDGMLWHMVHGANCWGYDKVSMEDRVQWVRDNIVNIRGVARDPLRNVWWMEADKPWAFLAWCFDYCDVLEGFESHIAVAMDGSCNGLQHFSAMLRDPEGAAAVNLAKADKPQDIYQRVADVVVEDLKRFKKGKEKLWARAWSASKIVDRKLCKRSVMVMPYGGTMTSTLRYVEEGVRDRFTQEELTTMFGDDTVKAIVLLSKLVHEATRKVVTSAATAMEWLQQVARVAAKADVHLKWTLPHGFVAAPHYVKYKMVRLDKGDKSTGDRIQQSLSIPTDKIDTTRMVNAISPNVVHSLDACAMMQTVLRAKRRGVEHFRMVHDDYGTHAADTPKLARALREVFVELYADRNWLAEFREQVLEQLPKEWHSEVPPAPKLGEFDVREVLNSEFFFA